jgi:AbrB family looped-hinge helix DNA binding protein
MKSRLATINSKGQITLPKEYRDKFHFLEGEEILMIPTKEGILIKSKTAHLRGISKGKIDIKGFEEDIKTLRKEHKIHAKSY